MNQAKLYLIHVKAIDHIVLRGQGHWCYYLRKVKVYDEIDYMYIVWSKSRPLDLFGKLKYLNLYVSMHT